MLAPSTTRARYLLPLFSAPPKSGRPPKLPGHQPLSRLRRLLRERLETTWAASTLAGYRSIFRRFLAWTKREQLPPTDEAAAMFIEALPVSNQSRLTYGKALTSVLSHLGVDVAMLRALCAALRADGAEAPMKQARPMTQQQLEQARLLFPPAEVPALVLAWVTASRWDDVAKLTTDGILETTPTEIVLHFGKTKANRRRKYRPQDLVVIRGRHVPLLLPFVRRLLRRARASPEPLPVTQLTTRQVRDLLRPLGLTAHSIKAGAISVLTAAAAQGLIKPMLIPMMARHKGATAFPEVTARYARQVPTLARVFGTQRATQLL